MSQILSYKKELEFKNNLWSWVKCDTWDRIIEYLHTTSIIIIDEDDFDKKNQDRLFLLKMIYPQSVIILTTNCKNDNRFCFVDYCVDLVDLETIVEKIVLKKYVKIERKVILERAFNHFINRRCDGDSSTEY